MACSRWPEPRKTKKTNCRPHVHRVRQEPQWGLAVLFFLFFYFRGFCMVCSRWPEPRKTKNKTADHMSTESDKSPNEVCSFLFFFDFRGFCMVCSRWPEPRKTKKQNCRPHVHRVRQEPQAGLALLFFVFYFRGFCMACSRWPEPRKSKKTTLQTTCPQSQTRAPMGSAVLLFIFDVFAWFALLYTVVIISNCPLLCESM